MTQDRFRHKYQQQEMDAAEGLFNKAWSIVYSYNKPAFNHGLHKPVSNTPQDIDERIWLYLEREKATRQKELERMCNMAFDLIYMEHMIQSLSPRGNLNSAEEQHVTDTVIKQEEELITHSSAITGDGSPSEPRNTEVAERQSNEDELRLSQIALILADKSISEDVTMKENNIEDTESVIQFNSESIQQLDEDVVMVDSTAVLEQEVLDAWLQEICQSTTMKSQKDIIVAVRLKVKHISNHSDIIHKVITMREESCMNFIRCQYNPNLDLQHVAKLYDKETWDKCLALR